MMMNAYQSCKNSSKYHCVWCSCVQLSCACLSLVLFTRSRCEGKAKRCMARSFSQQAIGISGLPFRQTTQFIAQYPFVICCSQLAAERDLAHGRMGVGGVRQPALRQPGRRWKVGLPSKMWLPVRDYVIGCSLFKQNQLTFTFLAAMQTGGSHCNTGTKRLSTRM